jgi:antirestriction protein ArdC
MARKPATPAQIAAAKARRTELNDQLERFLAANDGESFAYAKINGGYYSERNGALIAMQAEARGVTVTAVGSYDDWKRAGRQVRRGETSLRVLAPAGSREVPADEETGTAAKTRRFFKLVPVFAFEQTDAIADLEPESAEVAS